MLEAISCSHLVVTGMDTWWGEITIHDKPSGTICVKNENPMCRLIHKELTQVVAGKAKHSAAVVTFGLFVTYKYTIK